MASAATALFLQPCGARIKQRELQDLRWSPLLNGRRTRTRKTCRSVVPMARLFGPAIFEASKLKVLFLGDKENSGQLPRTYTLTHSDITSKLTLAISNTINAAQLGWYNKLQRDEVVAEWKKVQGKMSLHVHCHISGGHFLLDFIANLRYYIFSKELPVVLKAFVHGDVDLFINHPELEEAMVWVYFHSNLPEFNRLECWGPLQEAVFPDNPHRQVAGGSDMAAVPKKCPKDCSCCFPSSSSIPWAHEFDEKHTNHGLLQQQQQQQL